MEGNPYMELANALRGDSGGAGGLCLGTVSSWPSREAPAQPCRVVAEGTTQEREDLLAAPSLLPYGLEAGDLVVLLPIEEAQRYIILCKAVSV